MSPRELAWPCPNVVPGMAPVAAILARTDETVVAVTGIRAYPAGFGFTLKLRLRNLPPRQRRGFWPFPEFGRHHGRAWPDDALRLTVESPMAARQPTSTQPPSGLVGRIPIARC